MELRAPTLYDCATICRAMALQCLQRCPTNNNKFTFTAENHTYNFLVDGGFSFLGVADDK